MFRPVVAILALLPPLIGTRVAAAQVQIQPLVEDRDQREAGERANPAQVGVAAGEEPKESLAEVKVKESAMTAAEALQYPRVTARSIAEVFDLAVREKFLHLSSPLSAPQPVTVSVEGLKGLTIVEADRTGEAKDAPLRSFSLHNIDYDVTLPGQEVVAVHTWLRLAGTMLRVDQDYHLLSDEPHSVQLIQNLMVSEETKPTVSLHVQIGDRRWHGTADNVVELRRKHPAEMAKYVDPMLRTLRQENVLAKVDPKVAWQVFPDAYVAPADLLARVRALVKQLDADDFKTRESASKSLEKLGQPAALALLKLDRGGWSEEQIGRADAFLSQFRTMPDAEAQRLRHDPDFLLDCLGADEESIRRRALSELQKLIGRPIEFDLSASPQQRGAAAEKLRASIGAPATTQLSPGPSALDQ